MFSIKNYKIGVSIKSSLNHQKKRIHSKPNIMKVITI